MRESYMDAAEEPEGEMRPESDPMVVAALAECRDASDIQLVYCPECGWISYWNEGSHATAETAQATFLA